MWKTTSKKTPARRGKSRKARTPKKSISLTRLVVALSLLGFLLFTVGAVGYVIFFRTVLA